MSGRKKYVFETDRIAHIWMHDSSQGQARNPQDNFYFIGDTIYSYGSHFPIARKIRHKGQLAVLFTNCRYSNTTAKHISYVRRAIPGNVPVFEVNRVDGWCDYSAKLKRASIKAIRSDLKQQLARLERHVLEAKNKVSRGNRFVVLERATADANRFLEFFGDRFRFKVRSTDELRELAATAQARKARADKLAAKKREKIALENAAHNAEEYRQWRAGRPGAMDIRGWSRFDYRQQFGDLLRVNGDMIETSEGAEFPVDHALRALPIVKNILETGEPWRRSEEGPQLRLGIFTIDSVTDKGIRAGCHLVKRDEALRLIEALEQLPKPLDALVAS